MAKVEGVDKLRAALAKKATVVTLATAKKVTVGYTAAYAVFVHENLEAFHPIGQAKFLETPMREKSQEMAKIVLDAVKRGLPLDQALLLGGLFLQRASQDLCPVLTGYLRNSAFTRVD